MIDKEKRNFVIFSVVMGILVLAILLLTATSWVPHLNEIWMGFLYSLIKFSIVVLAIFLVVLFFFVQIFSGIKLSRWIFRLYPNISVKKYFLFSVAPAFVSTFFIVWLNVQVATLMGWSLILPVWTLVFVAVVAFYVSYVFDPLSQIDDSDDDED